MCIHTHNLQVSCTLAHCWVCLLLISPLPDISGICEAHSISHRSSSKTDFRIYKSYEDTQNSSQQHFCIQNIAYIWIYLWVEFPRNSNICHYDFSYDTWYSKLFCIIYIRQYFPHL